MKKTSGAKEGLKQPMGSSHWEKKMDDTSMGGSRYASEMNTASEYKSQVDGLANYVKKNKMKY